MKQIGLIAGAAALVAALVLLNTGIGRNAQPDQDDDDHSSSQAQQATPKPVPKATTATPPPATLPAEQTLGDPATAKYKITVGWAYDNRNQSQPAALSQSLDAVRRFAQTHKDVAAQIVNVDVPPEARSPSARTITGPGVAVNGKPVAGLNGNPGEGLLTPAQMSRALEASAP